LGFASADIEEGVASFYRTKSEKTFIGGDALRGASTAINAIGDGRKAAEMIMKASGIDFRIEKQEPSRNHSVKDLMIKRAERAYAPAIIEIPACDRKNFRLVNEKIVKEEIIKEAGRCLYCDEICNICTTVCPNFANYSFTTEPIHYNLKKAFIDTAGKVEIVDDTVFKITQKYQILNIANFCNNCGNCNTFCPTSGAPYKKKPGFFLTRSSFNAEKEGYYVDIIAGRRTIIHKIHEEKASLSESTSQFIYETENVLSKFNADDFRLMEIEIKNSFTGELRFENAAKMSILLKGSENLVFS
jgi:putative selenate reductase